MGVLNSFPFTLQISIGWLYVVTSVIPLALKGILPIRIIPIGGVSSVPFGIPFRLPVLF